MMGEWWYSRRAQPGKGRRKQRFCHGPAETGKAENTLPGGGGARMGIKCYRLGLPKAIQARVG